MSSRKQTDDLIDLSMRHSLKNWATHKDPPTDGRNRLLAVVQKEISLPQRKPRKFNFEWLFHLLGNQTEFPIRPINNHEFEYIDFLKTTMAFL